MEILYPCNATHEVRSFAQHNVAYYMEIFSPADLLKANCLPREVPVSYYYLHHDLAIDPCTAHIITDNIALLSKYDPARLIVDLTTSQINSELLKLLKELKMKRCIVTPSSHSLIEGCEVFIKIAPPLCTYTHCYAAHCHTAQFGQSFCELDFDMNSWFFSRGMEEIPVDEQMEILSNQFEYKNWLYRCKEFRPQLLEEHNLFIIY